MNVFLLYRDRDFDPQAPLTPGDQALIQDLELETLIAAMARGDVFLADVIRKVMLSSLMNADAIRYRQDVLRDCMRNPDVIRTIYDLSIKPIENRKKFFFGVFSRFPSSILYSSVQIMQMFLELLRRLRNIADNTGKLFTSEGFVRFFAMVRRELDDDYLERVQQHLRDLQFRHGVLLSAELGLGNEGVNYTLRKPNDQDRGWFQALFTSRSPTYSFSIADRDESGARTLSELQDRGLNRVANALAQSADHMQSFFAMLRTELAFYLGCLNLHARLRDLSEPICFPAVAEPEERRHTARGLYDVSLALHMQQTVAGNDLNADGKELIIVTGANQGGKSTFLRSIGLAQLMMQSGMFVPAEAFCANLCRGVFTHYRREEDKMMKSGKLDEELARMSDIADNMHQNALILFNESFAATNEREGSEIAAQIVRALLERQIKVVFVTHLYEFARREHERRRAETLFLRAERQPDGTRTFRLTEGAPLQTSYGDDLYRRIFGEEGCIRLEAQAGI
jgi:hypothetical protein